MVDRFHVNFDEGNLRKQAVSSFAFCSHRLVCTKKKEGGGEKRFFMKHILITGVPGSGKTTLCLKLIERLRPMELRGFVTAEKRDKKGDRTGFVVEDVATREEAQLASSSPTCVGPKVGKYSVCVDSFERIALPSVDTRSAPPGTIIFVDELGKMEMMSKRFAKAAEALLSQRDRLVVATFPVRSIEIYRAMPNVEVFEISRANRDAVADDVFRAVLSQSVSKT